MSTTLHELIAAWDGIAVVSRFDAPTGTWIFICLHDDTLGQMTGGTRMKSYPRKEDALRDAMRLAEGMTHKWAGLGLDAGGAKAVLDIRRPMQGEERRGLLARYGALVQSLHGSFSTGEDLGTSTEDMRYLSGHTRYVQGFDPESGEKVDPSPFTAAAVFHGIRAALRAVFGSDDPAGRSVLIEGVGHVGWELGRLLAEAGAHVLACDIDAQQLEKATRELGAAAVAPADAYSTPCDVFAPCAVGATVNRETAATLACRLVAGSANNQLGESEDAERLHRRGIVYVPDYVVNAGGALAFHLLSRGVSDREEIMGRMETIGTTVGEILTEAAERQESPLAAARRRVERNLASGADQRAAS